MDQLLKRRGEKVRDAIVKHYHGYWKDEDHGGLGEDYPKPILQEAEDQTYVKVVWEEGPDGWALLTGGGFDEYLFHNIHPEFEQDAEAAKKLATRRAVEMPDGIITEPHTSYALAVW